MALILLLHPMLVMRYLLFITILTFCFSSGAQEESRADTTKTDRRFISSVTFQFDKYFPFSDNYKNSGVERFGAFGLSMEFWNIEIGMLRIRQRMGISIASKLYEDIHSDIILPNGLLGGFEARANRNSAYIGPTISVQPIEKLKIGIPLNFAIRQTSDIGYFNLYNNQGFDEEEMQEYRDENKVELSNDILPGFKTGLELTIFPEGEFSIILAYNFERYGERKVFDHNSNPQYFKEDGPGVFYDPKIVGKTSELGFSIGLRMYFSR